MSKWSFVGAFISPQTLSFWEFSYAPVFFDSSLRKRTSKLLCTRSQPRFPRVLGATYPLQPCQAPFAWAQVTKTITKPPKPPSFAIKCPFPIYAVLHSEKPAHQVLTSKVETKLIYHMIGPCALAEGLNFAHFRSHRWRHRGWALAATPWRKTL